MFPCAVFSDQVCGKAGGTLEIKRDEQSATPGDLNLNPPLIMSITRVTGPCSHNATQPNYSLVSDLIPPAFLASGSQPEL